LTPQVFSPDRLVLTFFGENYVSPLAFPEKRYDLFYGGVSTAAPACLLGQNMFFGQFFLLVHKSDHRATLPFIRCSVWLQGFFITWL
jgi:hypothetical protein